MTTDEAIAALEQALEPPSGLHVIPHVVLVALLRCWAQSKLSGARARGAAPIKPTTRKRP